MLLFFLARELFLQKTLLTNEKTPDIAGAFSRKVLYEKIMSRGFLYLFSDALRHE